MARGIARVLLALVIAGAIGAPGRSQEREELERLRQELARTRQRLEQQRRKEQALLDVLAGLDREIDLTHRLVRKLQKQSERKRRQIRDARREIARLERKLKRLQETYRKRVVSYYKHGRLRDLELLIRNVSLNRTLVWLKFERLLADRDRRAVRQIRESKKQIEARRRLLELQVREQEQLLQEKASEEEALKARRAERAKLLAQVRRDKKLYQQRLREIEEAAREIRRLIGQRESERRRGAGSSAAVSGRNFADLKGKLPWPVKGKVILHFGRYKHPKFKTVTENLGIDIRAPMGTPVRAVSDGRVTAITWQRARGNIVIVSHPGGYYTVYTHLGEILVAPDEEVTAGQVLGTVGDTGSLEGPKLHFQVWHNTENLDPEEWLRP